MHSLSLRSMILFGALPLVALLGSTACSGAPSASEHAASTQSALLPTCSASVSCPDGWYDTPPQITVACASEVAFYWKSPGGTEGLLEYGKQYAGSMSDYAGFIEAYTLPITDLHERVEFSSYAPPETWCNTGTGSGGGGGHGKGGCQGTCQ